MVFGQTDGVFAATVLNADGLARVSGAVARLGPRAIAISQTFDLATTFRSGRVAGVKAGRRAGAFSCVVVGHADGPVAATNRRADGNTAADSGAVRFARFHFAALGVRLALVFRHLATAIPVVGVSGESSAANALANVVSCPAVGIGRASVSSTDGRALANTQHVRTADGIGSTVGVCYTIRHCQRKNLFVFFKFQIKINQNILAYVLVSRTIR